MPLSTRLLNPKSICRFLISACQQLWQDLKKPVVLRFLLLLLGLDVCFIVLSVLEMVVGLNFPLLAVDRDFGIPEFYQYAKELWIVVVLGLTLVKTRNAGYLVWSLFFFYLLVDDSMKIHERGGIAISDQLGFVAAFGLRAQDFGELAVTFIAAAGFLAFILLTYLRGGSSFRQTTVHLILFMVLLGLFGVVVDAVHVALKLGWQVSVFLAHVEDGGEMIVMSLIAGYVFVVHSRGENAGFSAPTSSS